MNPADLAIFATVVVGILAFFGKLISDKSKVALAHKERKIKAYDEFSIAFNRRFKATKSLLSLGKRLIAFSEKVGKIDKVTEASNKALVALSNRPESGISEILKDLDEEALRKKPELPSELINSMLEERKRLSEAESNRYVKFLDETIRDTVELPKTFKKITEDKNRVSEEESQSEIEIANALSKIQLNCSQHSFELARSVVDVLGEYLYEHLTESQVLENYEIFMAVAKKDLDHPFITKIRDRLKLRLKIEKKIHLPPH